MAEQFSRGSRFLTYESADSGREDHGRDRWPFVPEPPPWPLELIGDVVSWAYLQPAPEQRQLLLPWLFLEEPDAPNDIAFALPRLAPEARFDSPLAAIEWEETVLMRREAPAPSVKPTLGLDEVMLPSGRGRPKHAAPFRARIVHAAITMDLGRLTSQQFAERDALANVTAGAYPERIARDERRRGREFLCVTGVLPWAVFTNGRLPDAWWLTESFAAGLRQWRSDAAWLWWREMKSERWSRSPRTPAQRVATDVGRRKAQAWSGLPTPEPSATRLAAERGILERSARDSDSFERWLRDLVAPSPHSHPDTIRAVVEDLEKWGALNEFQSAWRAGRHRVRRTDGRGAASWR